MATSNDTGLTLDSPTTSNKASLADHLDNLDSSILDFVCLHQFYHSALYALAKEEDLPRDKDWLFGFFHFNQWLEEQGNKLCAEVNQVKALVPYQVSPQ